MRYNFEVSETNSGLYSVAIESKDSIHYGYFSERDAKQSAKRLARAYAMRDRRKQRLARLYEKQSFLDS